MCIRWFHTLQGAALQSSLPYIYLDPWPQRIPSAFIPFLSLFFLFSVKSWRLLLFKSSIFTSSSALIQSLNPLTCLLKLRGSFAPVHPLLTVLLCSLIYEVPLPNSRAKRI